CARNNWAYYTMDFW
nr:immunoglobulin heavy chain junction region [Mus musculus]MBK4185871.1 immunoglobulin heavy chain junction region [Mus musculus]